MMTNRPIRRGSCDPADPTCKTAASRRQFLRQGVGGAIGGIASLGTAPRLFAEPSGGARIAITLDLEMSRNFPTWDSLHWDYEKGNLNDATKRYAGEAARRVKAAGGVVHFFALGQTLEQEDIDWMRALASQGHPIGNHTYDHVNVTATRLEDLQFRFQRAPWLLRGRSVNDAIAENIRLCELALQQRLGVRPRGFRTPGGFRNGLRDLPQIRSLLREAGYTWVSSLYPPHPYTEPGQPPSEQVLRDIVAAQRAAQPFVYPDGLVEIPMSPISDIGAFRTCRWKLDWFLEAIRRSVQWAISNQAVFDFLAHPSCLYVIDPELKAVQLICDLVDDAGDRARIVDLDQVAQQAVGSTVEDADRHR